MIPLILAAQLVITSSAPPLSPAQAAAIMARVDSIANRTNVPAPPRPPRPAARWVVGPDASGPAISEWWSGNYPNVLDRGWVNPVVVPVVTPWSFPVLTAIPSGRLPDRMERK